MSLVHAFTQQSDAWSSHQRRHLSALTNYNCTLQQVHGKITPVAKALSRNTLATVPLGLLLKTKFIWHGINKYAKDWVPTCTSLPNLQSTSTHGFKEGTFPQPQRRFTYIYVDVLGPLLTSQGDHYSIIIIDHSTRWPEAIPMETATSASCTSALRSRLIARFGISEHITSDRDSHWFTLIYWVLLGLRTTPKDTLNVSAAEMVYADLLFVSADFFPSATSYDDLQRICHLVGKFTPCRQTYKPPAKHSLPTDLHSATHVFLRNDTREPPLMPAYTGPFLVI
ncbi:uncharacterized protein [Palaemon carinicauda]|uniref:uncharacterized protein n=1 Tax=Palaemon carinicauda TaxID=392227 RepID=UPI0035B6A358